MKISVRRRLVGTLAFFDVTVGNNTADPTVPGYPATTGWDPITGLGTPNAAALLPDLVAAVNAP